MRYSGLSSAVLLVLIMLAGCPKTNAPGGYGGAGDRRDGLRCPMCGGDWQSTNGWDGTIPASLPKPTSDEWTNRLREVLALEKHSRAQYEADYNKYRVPMPYRMIIPQEDDHIRWITELFDAYGLKSDGKVPAVKETATLDEAYRLGIDLESDLVERYAWLITNTGDDTSKRVLDTIMLESQFHRTMFDHALGMGGRGMGHMRGRRE